MQSRKKISIKDYRYLIVYILSIFYFAICHSFLNINYSYLEIIISAFITVCILKPLIDKLYENK